MTTFGFGTLVRFVPFMLWVSAYPQHVAAQVAYKLEHLTPKNGLSYRWTLDVTQDSSGHIWIATFDGLNRYDGHRFDTYFLEVDDELGFSSRQYRQVDCLPGNEVRVTTASGLMIRFDRKSGRFEPIKGAAGNAYSVKVRPLYTTNSGYEWCLLGENKTAREWLARMTTAGRFDTILELGPHSMIQKQVTALDDGNRFWGRSNDTYYIFDPKARTQALHRFDAIPGVRVAHPSLPIDGLGRLWYPGPGGNFRFFSLPPNIPVGQWEQYRLDNKGNFWVWSHDKRTYRYEVSSGQTDYFGVFDFWEYDLNSPFEDQEGTIWIPHFYGVTKLVRQRRLFENFLNVPLNALGAAPGGTSVSDMVEGDNGSVFVKLADRRWVLLRPGTTVAEPVAANMSSISAEDSAVLHQTADLLQLDPKHLMEAYYWDRGNGFVWCSTQPSMGVTRVDLKTKTRRYFALMKSPHHLFSLLPLGNHLWIGTDDGLYRLGLGDSSVRRYTTKEGLPHNTIYTMLPDGNNLWLGTHDGLCRFDAQRGATQNYYTEDGLTHNEFNRHSALKTRNGKLYFGGLNGVNAFFPAELEVAPARFRPRVHLTRLSRFDNLRDTMLLVNYPTEGPAIRLLATDRSVAFEFFLSSFQNPAQNKYLYYLDGLETPWANQTNDGRATYPFLPPGHYVFRVKASGPFGNWAANEIALPVEMPQVWYLRWWACLGYALAALGGGVFWYRFRLRRHLERREALRLRELDEVKNKLYTNITHEFRTPLTVILGMTEQLTTAPDPVNTGMEQKLDTIRRNGEGLLLLVNQMLDLAKLESGKLSLHLVQADIIQFLRYVTGSFQSFAEHKNIVLQFQSDLRHVVMDLDKERLQHVLSNLLSNAIKFTEPGGQVHVHAARAGERFVIRVRDTGIGIPAEKLPRIFDRFYQVDDSRTRKGEGTGIGLALVRELVRLMGGDIGVESRLGAGSEFVVSLPVAQKAPLTADAQGPFRQERAVPESPTLLWEEPADTRLPLLLIVEDNADVAEYIRSCLDGQFRILHAANGLEGIEKAVDEIPDIVLSDVMMPEKDGFEVVQTLRGDDRTNHIPVVLLTAKADIASKLEGLERGADAYLPKPFHPKELQLCLRNLLERQRRLQEKFSGRDFASLHPSTPEEPADPQHVFLQKAAAAVLVRLDDAAYGNEELSREMTMSESQLNRKIKALTGKTLSLFIRSVRLREGMKLLANTDLTVSEIAYSVGFTDPAYFSRTFSAEFGKAPSAFRN
ncbi:MAG: ATP-binding protein [Saprospiraceae bacterium]